MIALLVVALWTVVVYGAGVLMGAGAARRKMRGARLELPTRRGWR